MKRFFCLLAVFVMVFVVAMPVFAVTYSNLPTKGSSWVVYKKSDGNYRFVTADSYLYFVKNSEGFYQFSNSSTAVVGVSPTDLRSYMSSDGVTWTLNNNIILNAPDTYPIDYESNQSIGLYDSGVLKAYFFHPGQGQLVSAQYQAPLQLNLQLGNLIAVIGAQSKVILIVGVSLLAILLGVRLVPRLVHLFQ